MLNFFSKQAQSIQRKISIGYYAVIFVVLCLSLFTYFEMEQLEAKILHGTDIHDFFDATLDVRRFEKNYFQYADPMDFQGMVKSLARARSFLDAHAKEPEAIISPEQIVSLHDHLLSYEKLLKQYTRLADDADARSPRYAAARKLQLESAIQDNGERISGLAQDIAKNEQTSLVTLSNRTQKILIVCIFSLSFGVIFFGRILSRSVVRPLAVLERNLKTQPPGSFERIESASRDREIVSLTSAFNKMLAELEQRQRQLVRAEKFASLGTLLSGVAHELNNPLSNISSSSQILQEELLHEQRGPDNTRGDAVSSSFPNTAFALDLISQINDQTDRARNIVRSLLTYSRDHEYNRNSWLLKPLFEETIRFLNVQMPSRARISVDIPNDLTIWADKQHIQQAFLNLMKNGLESMENEGRLFIQAKRHRTDDQEHNNITWVFDHLNDRQECLLYEDAVEILIRDTGAGISPDVLPRIFDPFFTTKEVGKGTGLGLYIVQEIIEQQQGCIAVESAPGKGTTFRIRLPEKE